MAAEPKMHRKKVEETLQPYVQFKLVYQGFHISHENWCLDVTNGGSCG